MTVPPLLGSSPSRPYKRCEVGVHFFLTSSTWLVTMKMKPWGSFCSLTSLMKVYQHDCTHVLEAHEQWKQGDQIKDVHWEAEAVRARAVANKACREAEEWS